jgi:hypothetical protein
LNGANNNKLSRTKLVLRIGGGWEAHLEIKLPLVGNGRYEEKELWRPALKIAREKCETISPDEIIIITQKTDIWFDAPVVVKCKFIAK